MTYLQSIILAVIEGLTEFLPVSSTGHMILASKLMEIQEESFVKTFEIAIQIGAIMAIVFLYAQRFYKDINLYFKLFTGFIPTAIIGFLAYGFIKSYLFNPTVVAVSLIIGGVILVLVDNKLDDKKSTISSLSDLSYKNAFFIGLIQCISMVPGVSRAAATIIGGMFNGLDKKQAMEFSFLLAVPTMAAATGYDLLKTNIAFSTQEIQLLCIGLIVAFITALIAVKIFLKIVEQYGFKHFGYYRIVVGILFLLLIN